MDELAHDGMVWGLADQYRRPWHCSHRKRAVSNLDKSAGAEKEGPQSGTTIPVLISRKSLFMTKDTLNCSFYMAKQFFIKIFLTKRIRLR